MGLVVGWVGIGFFVFWFLDYIVFDFWVIGFEWKLSLEIVFFGDFLFKFYIEIVEKFIYIKGIFYLNVFYGIWLNNGNVYFLFIEFITFRFFLMWGTFDYYI